MRNILFSGQLTICFEPIGILIMESLQDPILKEELDNPY